MRCSRDAIIYHPRRRSARKSIRQIRFSAFKTRCPPVKYFHRLRSEIISFIQNFYFYPRCLSQSLEKRRRRYALLVKSERDGERHRLRARSAFIELAQSSHSQESGAAPRAPTRLRAPYLPPTALGSRPRSPRLQTRGVTSFSRVKLQLSLFASLKIQTK